MLHRVPLTMNGVRTLYSYSYNNLYLRPPEFHLLSTKFIYVMATLISLLLKMQDMLLLSKMLWLNLRGLIDDI
jgi:hypothetical protein